MITQHTLQSNRLLAVLTKLSGSGNRYDFDETRLHIEMIDKGSPTCIYDPLPRVLTPLKTKQLASGHTLYPSNIATLTARLQSPPRMIHGKIL